MTPSRGHQLPLVSIVTPSYNMARFLPETMESVLSQDYPNLEYIVLDAGSTDGTLEILKSCKDRRYRYISAPDHGAADAINRGFAMSGGDIFAWLNADDTYLPGAIMAAARRFMEEPDTVAVYGQAYWVDSEGVTLKAYPTRPYSPGLLNVDCYICQPACFMRRTAFESAGGLDISFECSFDYDLWMRIANQGGFVSISEYLATSRMHSGNKTLSNRRRVFSEGFSILRRYCRYIPFHWIHSYVSYRMDKRDQYYSPIQPSVLNYCLSLPVGLAYNWRHMARYCREWFGGMSYDGAIRSWRRSWLGRLLS